MNSPSNLQEKPRRRLPDWFKVPLPHGENYTRLKSLVRYHKLNTVCESASCPNIGTCWNAGTLTLMIMGGTCTRACRFCDVPTGHLGPLDPGEPDEVASMLSQLEVKYTVITSVDRDDLPDGGALHWAKTLRAIRERCPHIKVEALIPDFRGDRDSIGTVCRAEPDILAHNLETVARLQKRVRPQCRYEWSLETLRLASREQGKITKSSLMLGLGETEEEVSETMRDLVSVGCQILSLGQYLAPTRDHLDVVEFISPERFARYKEMGERLGFLHVEAGPLVRSSFRADLQARAAGIE
ncbi:MAG: lipoyl synthase [Nitrospinae bacterium CG11_big_fil_rev_8_21_14_0_20_56_8]|nr:MAG: lipoyl synthase [Nitrospinae bacterium CG11_big_fil_rev_8_21_14_0_20_56_8]